MTDSISCNADSSCEPQNGRADFAVYLVTTNATLPEKRITGNIQLGEQQFAASRFQRAIPRDDMPTFEVGGLIVIMSAGQFTHIATVTSELEDEVAPSFEMFASPVKQPSMSIHRASQQGKARSLGFAFVTDTAPESFNGRIQKLGRDEADRIRKQIGPFVQPPYRNVYWSQAERQQIDADLAQIQANQAENARFKKNVATMIAEMERLNAAA